MKNHQKYQTVSRKENRVIRQVILVATIFIICKLPTVATVILRYADQDLAVFNGVYNKTATVIAGARYFFEGVCGSVNIFVYYNFNTRYRQILRHFLKLSTNE